MIEKLQYLINMGWFVIFSKTENGYELVLENGNTRNFYRGVFKSNSLVKVISDAYVSGKHDCHDISKHDGYSNRI